MGNKPQYLKTAELLAERISYGDYLLTEIPSSRKLAEEFGVSHIVARKAVEKLLADGLCRRMENGRIAVCARREAAGPAPEPTVAMLFPAFASNYFQRCRVQLERATERRRGLFRPVNFVHWNEPVIRETLNNFDGVFLFGSAEELDPAARELFRSRKHGLTTVDFDLTGLGIPRLAMFDASCVRPLLEHLKSLGFNRIDCINTQPCDVETTRRIGAWLNGMRELDYTGILHNEPVRAYEDPAQSAYELMRARLTGEFTAQAVFCTNENIAYGVARALLDAGKLPGRDIGLVAVGDGGNARFFAPSITCVEMPDMARELDQLLDWMFDPGKTAWTDEPALLPRQVPLFIGESTVWKRK